MPLLPLAKVGDLPISGGRRATADDFVPSGGAEIGHTARTVVAGYVNDLQEQESRTALVESSEIRAKYARALDDAALSGDDVALLKEKMSAELSKVGEQFQTRKGVENLRIYTANSDIMFDEQANKINVQRAAATARLEGSKFLNSAAAIMRSNPAYLPEAERNAEAFGETLKGVRPEQRAEIISGLKKELNMAAALASARIDPEGTLKRIQAGEWDLTPEHRQTAESFADTTIRARRTEDAYVRAEEERRKHEVDGEQRDVHFAGIRNGTATERSIMDDAGLLPATREHLIGVMALRAKETRGEGKASDPAVKRDLWLRIHAPDNDPRRILNGDAIFAAVQAGTLNTTDADQLNTLVANQKDDNNRTFGQRLAGRVNMVVAAMRSSPEYQAQPELAASIQLEIASRVEKSAADLRKAGTPPETLLDPESKDYFFKPGTIKAIADDVKRQKAESMPPLPQPKTQEEYNALDVGVTYIDTDGKTKVKKAGKSVEPLSDYQAWIQATGGKLLPGQTQEQAIKEWKGR